MAQKIDVGEFGRQVKQKYPQYKDMNDVEVGTKMLQKFPEYEDIVAKPYTGPTTTITSNARVRTVKPGFETLNKGLEATEGFIEGLGKSVLGTLLGASELGEKYIMSPIQRAVLPKSWEKAGGVMQPGEKTSVEKLGLNKLAEAQTTAQKAGKVTGDIAQFFTPGSAVTRGVKGIEGVVGATKLAPKAQKAASVLGRVGLESAAAGGVATAQTGDVVEGVKTAAITGALAPVGSGIKKISEIIPDNAWNFLLKRTPTEIAKNTSLGKQAAEAGFSGLSRKGLAKKAASEIQNIEVKLDDMLSISKGKISTADVASYLDEIKNTYRNIPGEQSSVKAIENIQKEVIKKGDLSLVEANRLKRDIYGLINKSYGKGTLEIPAKVESQKMIARGLKQEIEKVIPEVKDINAKQAIYLQLKKAIDKSITRSGKGIAGTGIGLYDLGVGGIATGFGGGIPGIAAIGLKKTLESPGFMTNLAKMAEYYNRLSPTKKHLFYQAIQGLSSKSSRSD